MFFHLSVDELSRENDEERIVLLVKIMSELTKDSRRRRRRDRTKTHSDVSLTSIPSRHKRPFDEINRSYSHGIKRRAISATTSTSGNENLDYSMMIIEDDEQG